MALQRLISPRQARQLVQQDDRVEVIETAERELSSRSEFVDAIGRAWGGVQRRFLLIGRYLVQAKGKLPHGEYLDMIERDLPFRRNIAFQLREVADAIDTGRVGECEVPPNYSVVYQLATLSDAELRAAREQGVVRPDVTRREVEAFKRLIRTPKQERTDALRALRLKLLAERDRILADLERINEELGIGRDDGQLLEGTVHKLLD
jgi:hypothetical protein